MRGVDRADQMLRYYPCCKKNREMYKGIYIIFTTDGCPKQFHVVQKVLSSRKSKRQGVCLQGLPDKKLTDLAQREDWSDSGDHEPVTSTTTARSPSPCKWRPVTDAADCLQSGLEFRKNGSCSLNEGKKGVAMGKCLRSQEKEPVLSFRVARCGILQKSVFRGILRDEKLLNRYKKICIIPDR
jgi:coenzyme F420-reducing hydrogenase gamma subunit